MWLRRFVFALIPVALAAQTDPVAALSRRIEDGTAAVRFDAKRGYVPWLLDALDIPVESQMLVFSKTSVQAMLIAPNNPRRLYFNDSVILGSVRGGPVELVAQDSAGRIVFYLADQTPFRYREFLAGAKPISPIRRREDCLSCHASKASGMPRTLIRSVSATGSGVPIAPMGVLDTDNRTPFEQLWGGWYVTGKTEAHHAGNMVFGDDRKPVPVQPPADIDPNSDIVALLVFEHQMRVMNLLSAAAAGGGIDELARALLFIDEAPLPAKVAGLSGFAEKFSARGPRDSQGRSLRDLDLNSRLMRYRCSYMIYSAAFEGLPAAVKSSVYRRIWELLATRDADERRVIVDILRVTKPDLPGYYHGARQ